MRIAFAFALVAASTSVAAADDPVDPQITADLDTIVRDAPACTAAHCLPVHLHIAAGDHALVQSPAWVDAQLAMADRQHAAIDVGFQIVSIDLASAMHVVTRADRDAIVGTRGLHAGAIDVYVVFRLDDVDEDGVIRGVTWRRARDKDERKYIIIANNAPARVLAHELGHFFGLPHSTYAVSIMNKTPRDDPPPDQRRFADDEVAAMKPELRRLLAAKVVVELARPKQP